MILKGLGGSINLSISQLDNYPETGRSPQRTPILSKEAVMMQKKRSSQNVSIAEFDMTSRNASPTK